MIYKLKDYEFMVNETCSKEIITCECGHKFITSIDELPGWIFTNIRCANCKREITIHNAEFYKIDIEGSITKVIEHLKNGVSYLKDLQEKIECQEKIIKLLKEDKTTDQLEWFNISDMLPPINEELFIKNELEFGYRTAIYKRFNSSFLHSDSNNFSDMWFLIENGKEKLLIDHNRITHWTYKPKEIKDEQ